MIRRSLFTVVLASSVALASPAWSESASEDWSRDLAARSEPERVDVLDQLWRDRLLDGCEEQDVSPLLAATHDPSHRVRSRANHILGLCGQTEAASAIADRWLAMMDDPDERPEIVSSLIGELGRLGVAEPAVVDRLVRIARAGEDRIAVRSAVASLGLLGVADDRVLGVVLAQLRAGPRSPRVVALVALRSLVPALSAVDEDATTTVVAAICAQLPADDVDVNQQAALVLGLLGERAAAAVPVLIETFRARRFSRSQVAYALGEIGAEASPAIPLLRDALSTATGPERATLENALQHLAAVTADRTTP